MKNLYTAFWIFVFLFSGILRTYGQVTEKTKDSNCDSIYWKVDEVASFPGGVGEMLKFISKHSRLEVPYTDCPCKECRTNKRPIVEFIVEKDGSLSHFEIIRGADSILNKKAIEVMEKMPLWIPGKNNGQPVRTLYRTFVPIRLGPIMPGHH